MTLPVSVILHKTAAYNSQLQTAAVLTATDRVYTTPHTAAPQQIIEYMSTPFHAATRQMMTLCMDSPKQMTLHTAAQQIM